MRTSARTAADAGRRRARPPRIPTSRWPKLAAGQPGQHEDLEREDARGRVAEKLRRPVRERPAVERQHRSVDEVREPTQSMSRARQRAGGRPTARHAAAGARAGPRSLPREPATGVLPVPSSPVEATGPRLAGCRVPTGPGVTRAKQSETLPGNPLRLASVPVGQFDGTGQTVPRRRRMDVHERRRGPAVHQGRGRQVRRRPLLRPAGRHAALQRPGCSRSDEDFFTEGQMFDGSSIRGFQAIHESDMKLIAGPRHGLHRPVPHGEDAQHQLLDRRPVHRRALQPRPAQRRREGRGVPQEHRHRRHRVLRPRGRVLHLRRRALRDEAERRLLLHRLHRGRLEHAAASRRAATAGYKTRYKGGYFPVPPVDHYADLRDQMASTLDNAGLEVERAHHEVGTAGQAEINYKFSTAAARPPTR